MPYAEDEIPDYLSSAFAYMYRRIVPLLQRKVAVNDVKLYLKMYCDPATDLPYVDPALYRHITTTEEVLDALLEHHRIGFLNFGLLARILKRFGCEECNHLFLEYVRKVMKAASRKRPRNELSDEQIDSCHYTKKLKVKIEEKSVTFYVVERVKEGLEKSSGVSRDVIIYAKHDPASVLLTFMVPETTVVTFTDIGNHPEQLSDLATIGILSIEIDVPVTIDIEAQLKAQHKMEQLSCLETLPDPDGSDKSDEAASESRKRKSSGGGGSAPKRRVLKGHSSSSK